MFITKLSTYSQLKYSRALTNFLKEKKNIVLFYLSFIICKVKGLFSPLQDQSALKVDPGSMSLYTGRLLYLSKIKISQGPARDQLTQIKDKWFWYH